MHLSIFIRYLNIVPPLNCIVVYIFQNRHYIFIFLQYEGLSWFKTDANLWASHFYQFYNIHDQGHRWNICLGGFWLHNGHNNGSSGMSHLDACCIYKYQTLSRTCHSHNILHKWLICAIWVSVAEERRKPSALQVTPVLLCGDMTGVGG